MYRLITCESWNNVPFERGVVMRALSFAVLLSFAAVASANEPAPPPEPEPAPAITKAPVTIKYEVLRGDAAGAQAKIVIPRSLLPGEAGRKVGAAQPIGGTVIAGIALSLAAVSLIWLRKGKTIHQKVLIVVVSGALALGGVGALFADIPVPGGGNRPRPRPPVERPVPAKAMILVEIVEDGEAVTLTLPPR
jgi:hypothetical protein